MIIYKITNKLNGKTYIGQTRKTVAERIKGHIYDKSRVGKEIIEFGQENFDISVIDSADTQQELDELERFWIAFYNSQENGYNVLLGGKPTKEEFKLLHKFPRTKKKKRKKVKTIKVTKTKKISFLEAEKKRIDCYLDALEQIKKSFM